MLKHRSWKAFGTSVMGIGAALIVIVILYCSTNAQISIIPIMVAVAGIGIIFLGDKIASLDREEKEGMLWVDPNLDYHFFLTFRGTEQEITDFSRMEEALIEFDKHREAWKLRIVPPMGTLFEWTGYYDYKKNIYMTERAYAREAGIQRFKIYSEYDGMVQLNQKHLKEIIANLKKVSGQPSTPVRTTYRPEQAGLPDLSTYQKRMLLHNITCAEVDALLREYAEIYADEKQIVCDFSYTTLPHDASWIYLVFPNFENTPHHVNFWNYQNLLIWFSQKTDKEFCLATPGNQKQPIFLSTVDRDNPNRDSCVGIYADRSFHYAIPENRLEWGPAPTSAHDYEGFLKDRFQFDTKWILEINRGELKNTRITLSISE